VAKYDPLRDHLAALTGRGQVRMTFAEVERLVGALPASARQHQAWWSNNSKVEATAWRSAGWHVAGFNLTEEWVVFEPGGVGGSRGARQLAVRTQASIPGVAKAAGPAVERREADVQADVVRHLTDSGWTIVRQADTATKERGIDIVATLGDRTVAVEVKGYPGRGYADPARAGETKPTSPSTQARHWYAQAVLTALLTRDEHPQWDAVIAVPEAETYASLGARTEQNLATVGIELWRVLADGTVVS
jgi:Holliday junction resolvase-like predicted endonuclease